MEIMELAPLAFGRWSQELLDRAHQVAIELTEHERQYRIANGWPVNDARDYTFVSLPKKKFIHINGSANKHIGSSGAFLVDMDGEIYNIKSYGVPDHNKKRKANLGNIWTVDTKVLHIKQFNYLR